MNLAPNLIADSTYVSIGLWFKVASGKNGVLFSYQGGAIGTTPSTYTPSLYVGTDGKLNAELWNGSDDPMTSTASVADGKWHYVVLAGGGNTQTLYLDGAKVTSMSGAIDQLNETVDSVGAGRWAGSNWPDHTTSTTGYLTGSVAEVAVYPVTLGAPVIAEQYALATAASTELTQVTLPSGSVYQQVSYNAAADRIAAYTDPNGGQWQLGTPVTTGIKPTSEQLGEVTRSVTVTDPAGRQEVYSYDALNGGRIVSYDRGAGTAPRTFGYNQAGYLDAITDEDANTTSGPPTVAFTTDAFGDVLSRSWSSPTGCGSTGVCATYYSYFQDVGNPLDPKNGELTGVRDGRSASSSDNTYLTSYAYNGAGEMTSATTPPTSGFASGRTTSYAYASGTQAALGGGDIPAGLLLSVTTPSGAVTSYDYYSDGDLGQITTPSGLRTVYAYDGLGRAQSATQYSDSFPAGLVTSYTYNTQNQPLTITYPSITDSVTNATRTLQDAYTYDPDGNLTQLQQSDLSGVDPARTTTWVYNGNGRVATRTDPAGDTTAYDYDLSGDVTSVTDADGNEYDYAYNAYGEVTSVALTAGSEDPSNPGGGTSEVLAAYSYDPSGLLAASTDALGRITNYAYNGAHQLIEASTTDPVSNTGREASYIYDAAGNLTSTALDQLAGGRITAGTQTSYTVDADDQVTSKVLDPNGLDRTTSYGYNADGRVTSSSLSDDAGTTTTNFGYDLAGDLTSQIVQDGSTSLKSTWTFNELGDPLTKVSPLGNVTGGTPASFTTSYGYDSAGDRTSMTSPPVPVQTYTAQTPVTTRPVTTYGYDIYGDQVEVQDPDGNVSKASYDGDGRPTSTTRPSYLPPGSATPVTAVTSASYDGLGNLTALTDPAGNTTTFGYDALGDLTSQTDPQVTGQAAGTWAWTYDADGERLTATDPTGAQSQSTWDYFGDLATSTQDVRGSGGTTDDTTGLAYSYLGQVTQATSPDGAIIRNTYDPAGELTSTADAFGDTTGYAYNRLGEATSVTNPDQTSTTYAYDAAGNRTGATEWGVPPPAPATTPMLDSQSFGFDANADLTSATDGRGNTTTWAYTAAGQEASQTTPLSASSSVTTSFGYDAAGNQTSFTNGGGKTTWTTYNSWNLPESVTEPVTPTAPAGSTWTTAYNSTGQPATVTQPGGITQTDAYDQLGELTQQTGSGAQAVSPAENYAYDLDGRLTSATAPGGTDTFTWNDASELTGTAGPSGAATLSYDGDGLLTGRTDAAGTTSYTYDSADRLATAVDPATAATLTYSYNADSQPTGISYATSAGAGPAQTLTYNGLHQLTGDTLKAASGTTIASQAWGYDPDGNLASAATTGLAGAGTTTYGYDQANWLTSATTGGTTTSFGYGNAGNLTQAGGTGFSYNAESQLTTATTTAGTTSYAYTASGALTTITPPAGSVQSFTSNAYGQTATATIGGTTTTYSYDGLGRLASRATGGTTTSLSYSGAGSTLASDGTTSYSYTPAGQPVGAKTGASGHSVLTDIHDDLVAIFPATTTASALTASVAYTPYGMPSATSGTMPAAGDEDAYADPATGDTNLGARWYSPSTGTFTSNDLLAGAPPTAEFNPSPYGYAANNPLINTDPSGHRCDGYCLGGEGGDFGVDEEGVEEPDYSTSDDYGNDGYGDAEAEADSSFGDDLRSYDELSDDDISEDYSPSGDYSGDVSDGYYGDYGDYGAPVEAEPVEPPPPPPPTDVYEGEDGAEAPDAPRALRVEEHVTDPDPGTEEVDPWKDTDRVVDEESEQAAGDAKAEEAATVGAEGSAPATGAADAAPETSVDLTQDPTTGIDEPEAPVPGEPVAESPAPAPEVPAPGEAAPEVNPPDSAPAAEPTVSEGEPGRIAVFDLSSGKFSFQRPAMTIIRLNPDGSLDVSGQLPPRPGLSDLPGRPVVTGAYQPEEFEFDIAGENEPVRNLIIKDPQNIIDASNSMSGTVHKIAPSSPFANVPWGDPVLAIAAIVTAILQALGK